MQVFPSVDPPETTRGAAGVQTRGRVSHPDRGRGASLVVVLGVAGAACSTSASAPEAGAQSPSRTTTTGAAAATTPRVVVTTTPAVLPRGAARAVLVPEGDGLLLLGGLDAGRSTTGEIIRIDPATGAVTAAGTLAAAVHDAAGASVGGRPMVFGGGNATETADVQAFGPDGRVSIVGHLPIPRSDLAAARVGDRVFLVGGYDGTRVRASTIATVDGVSFQVLGDLPVPVRYPAVAALGHDVIIIGGTTTGTAEGAVPAVQVLDTHTGAVRSAGNLPVALTDAVAVTLRDRVYVIGGIVDGVPSAQIWRLDLGTGAAPSALTPVAALPVALTDAAVAVVHGAAVVAGGESPALSSAVFTVEVR